MSPAFSAVLPAPTPTLSLFPDCPEHSPNARAPELAQLCEGPRGELRERAPADCPPQELTAPRADATKLVGIARLAASSPPGGFETGFARAAEYFVLPVRSILNRCDSNRVPFEWTINPYRGWRVWLQILFCALTHTNI